MTTLRASTRQAPDERTADRSLVLLFILTGGYMIANSTNISLSLAARILYASLLMVTTLLLVVGLLRRGRPHVAVPASLMLWATLMTLECLQIPVGPNNVLTHSVTDFVITISPLLVFILLSLWDADERVLLRGFVVLAAAGFVAAEYAWLFSVGTERFEAPPILGIVGPWVLATVPLPDHFGSDSVRRQVRAASMVAVIAVLPAVLGSRSRTALLVYVLSGAVAMLLPGLRRPQRLLFVVMGVLVMVVVWLGFGNRILATINAPALLQQVRVEDIVSGKADASLGTRINEIHDVRETMANEGSIADRLVGFGHGASYQPDRSFIVNNVNPETGRVHNIHVTPFTVWYRYGWLGVTAFVLLIGGALRAGLKNFRARPGALTAVLLVSLLMYLLDLLFRNSLTDPTFTLVLAATFRLAAVRDSEAGGDASVAASPTIPSTLASAKGTL